MTQRFDEIIAEEVEAFRRGGTYKPVHWLDGPMDRRVPMDGHGEVLVLSSNNYLGLAHHPAVVAAGKAALDAYGAGTASVRFICGSLTIHQQLEEALAQLHHTKAALTYPSCWQANTGAIPALMGESDAILSDALNHASLIDGCRMSKAKRLVYAHADMQDLETKLQSVQDARKILVVTDGVFSMEGDVAPLPDILALCQRYRAALFLDDCHGVGAIGAHGHGTAEYFGVEGNVDIISGTLGKALGGAAGGYITAKQPVIDYLYQVSRPQIFSNALPATVAGSALKALHVMMQEPERLVRLEEVTQQLREGLRQAGYQPLEAPSAITPIIIGETSSAIALSQQLLEQHRIFVTGFGYPVVPEGTARLRLQSCAALTDDDIAEVLEAFRALKQ